MSATILTGEKTINMNSTLHESRGSSPKPQPSGELGIHVLIGKLRRKQDTTGASSAAKSKFDPLWAYVRMEGAPLSQSAFQEAVSASVKAVLEQQKDKDALTLFKPIGKHISYHVTLHTGPGQPGKFNPPPTSLMSSPSKPHHPERPLQVDFYTHSTPAAPRVQALFTSQLNERLRIFDAHLGNGVEGKNTLGLTEISPRPVDNSAEAKNTPGPAETPGRSTGNGTKDKSTQCPAEAPNGSTDNGAESRKTPDPAKIPVRLVFKGWAPTVSRHDWACATELCVMALTLNRPGDLLHAAVTRSGRAPEAWARSHGELLSYLGRKMSFSWASGAASAALESEIEKARDNASRYPTQPGFMVLMRVLKEDAGVQREEELRRRELQQQYAVYGWMCD